MGRENRVKLRTKPIFSIMCCGEKTEVNYFKRLLQSKELPNTGVVWDNKKPSKLVEAAKKELTNLKGNFQVWVVFDKDNFEIEDFNSAVSDNEVKVAWSNPCFELWFLLHFIDWNSPIDNNKFIFKKIEQYITKLLPNKQVYKYTKNCNLIFKYLEDFGDRNTAIQRAFKLNNSYFGDTKYSNQNPNTTIHLLVNEILDSKL